MHLTDRDDENYRVEVDQEHLWTIFIWSGAWRIGHMYCMPQPPVLVINDLMLKDNFPVRESAFACILRKLLSRPKPTRNYRGKGLGTAMLNLVERLAFAGGLDQIEGWISIVDVTRDPSLLDWYRRRGFEVTDVARGMKVATLRKNLHSTE